MSEAVATEGLSEEEEELLAQTWPRQFKAK